MTSSAFRMLLRFCPVAILFALAGAVASASTLPAIRVHAEGHYLETADGRPFFWLGDTAWELIRATTRDEASYYLRTRARQGFTVIQTTAFSQVIGPNAGGVRDERPFIDADPTKPNDVYFQRVVEIVNEAATLGLYVALMPTWGDALTAPWGDGPRMFRLDNLDTCRVYGAYLGRLLRGRTNVVWLLGGDRPAKLDPSHPRPDAKAAGFPDDYDWRPIWRAIAAGLADGLGADPVCTYHPSGTSYTSDDLHQEPWLDFNGMQSGHGAGHDFPVWEWVARDYALTPVKPTLDLEPNYEDHPVNPWPRWNPALGYFRDHDVRKQCYRSVFAGACGVTYGHHAVWAFAGSFNPPWNFMDRDWIDGLHRPAGQQMIWLRQLIESRPFVSRIPDDSMVHNASPNRAEHITACRDRDGTYAFVYFPNSDQTATIDLTKLRAPQLGGWWFDPRTGFPHPLGLIDGGKAQDFQSPSYGPDWVLVLDDPASGYALPGQKPTPPDHP